MRLVAFLIFCFSAQSEALSGNEDLSNTSGLPCYGLEDGCYQKIKDFIPIELGAQSATHDEIISQIMLKVYSDAWATIQEYPDFTIQNLAMNHANGFVAEVHFTQIRLGDPQTIFVYGSIETRPRAAIVVTVTASKDLNNQQEDTRMNLKNLENVFNPRNFQSLKAQVRLDDYKRAQAVGAVVASWVSAMGLPAESKATALSNADIR